MGIFFLFVCLLLFHGHTNEPIELKFGTDNPQTPESNIGGSKLTPWPSGYRFWPPQNPKGHVSSKGCKLESCLWSPKLLSTLTLVGTDISFMPLWLTVPELELKMCNQMADQLVSVHQTSNCCYSRMVLQNNLKFGMHVDKNRTQILQLKHFLIRWL